MCGGGGGGSAVKKYCNKDILQYIILFTYHYFQNGLHLLQYISKNSSSDFFPRPLLSRDLEVYPNI